MHRYSPSEAKLVSFRIVLRDGSQKLVEAEAGLTLMQALREGGVDDILALCGGCCSCATCHVYIEGLEADALPPLSREEDELLDSSWHRRSTSRLSCQVAIDALLPEARIMVAPEE